MIYVIENAAAILAATIAGLAFAALWFRRNVPVATVITGFIASAWLCAILAGALILAPPKGGVWTMTLGSAIVIWAGFVAPVIAASYRFRALPWRTVATDAGAWLGIMVVQAIVLRMIGLAAPPG